MHSVKYEFFCALGRNKAKWQVLNRNPTRTRSLNWNFRDILLVLELLVSHGSVRRLVEDWNSGNMPLVLEVMAQNNTVDYTFVKMEERFCFLKHNQQDATLYNILYCCHCSTCFKRFFRLSSGAQKLFGATASSRTKQVWQVPVAACTVFELLVMSGKPARNM